MTNEGEGEGEGKGAEWTSLECTTWQVVSSWTVTAKKSSSNEPAPIPQSPILTQSRNCDVNRSSLSNVKVGDFHSSNPSTPSRPHLLQNFSTKLPSSPFSSPFISFFSIHSLNAAFAPSK